MLVATQNIGGHALVASTALELVAALVTVVLIDLEYFRSIRPSLLVSAYLFVTLLLDTARARTAWLISDNRPYPASLCASLALKVLLLILQNFEKRSWFIDQKHNMSDESIGGPFNQGLFIWLNSLLCKGYTALLIGNELPHIHEKLSSEDLSATFEATWAACNQKRKNALLFAVVKRLRWEVAGIVLPRLAVMGFSIAQPFIVGKVVSTLEQTDQLSLDKGYGLIGATAIVFVGIAVCFIP